MLEKKKYIPCCPSMALCMCEYITDTFWQNKRCGLNLSLDAEFKLKDISTVGFSEQLLHHTNPQFSAVHQKYWGFYCLCSGTWGES